MSLYIAYRYLNEHYTNRKKHDYMEHIQLQAMENETMEVGQVYILFEFKYSRIYNHHLLIDSPFLSVLTIC